MENTTTVGSLGRLSASKSNENNSESHFVTLFTRHNRRIDGTELRYDDEWRIGITVSLFY